ncbi:hypothetical protein LG003_22350, partial [Photorhabdus kleinii]|uniref:hypothetical protein n=1 Tax=Photorhabdus kleinii TaxID=768034 RepID=UPI0021D4BCC3
IYLIYKLKSQKYKINKKINKEIIQKNIRLMENIYIGYILAILLCFLPETVKSRNRFRPASLLPW